MRQFLELLTLVGVLAISPVAFAKSGPPIPVPQISAIEAITIAQDYFYNKETRIIDDESIKVKDYILISIQYTNEFKDKVNQDCAWKVIFMHLVHNDHSVVYKVTNDRKIIFLYATE